MEVLHSPVEELVGKGNEHIVDMHRRNEAKNKKGKKMMKMLLPAFIYNSLWRIDHLLVW